MIPVGELLLLVAAAVFVFANFAAGFLAMRGSR